MSTTFIEKSGIDETHSNGGLTQQAIFKKNNMKFKYIIKTDSYDFQSTAKLYAWTNEKGFALVISKQLKDSYGDNPTYQEPNKVKDFFNKVEQDMLSIALKFSS